MYTIGEICKLFDLSRSTILYYDKLGLLKPTIRESNNYRMYDERQVERLKKIMLYRDSGVALKEIGKILDPPNTEVSSILLNRLDDIQNEIEALKQQQTLVINVLKEEVVYRDDIKFTTKTWSELLRGLGYDDESCYLWHQEFEAENPTLHRKFLKSLSMTEEEIENLILHLKKVVNSR